MQKAKHFLLLFVLPFFISACATEAGRVFSLKDNIYSFEQANIEKTLPDRTFYFKAGHVSNERIYLAVTKSIRKSISNHFAQNGLPEPKINRDGFNKTLNMLLAANQKTQAPKVQSHVSVKPTTKYIKVSFIGGEYYGNRKGEAIQTANFPFKTYSKNGKVYFTIGYPTSYQHRKGNIGSQPAINPIFSHEEANLAFEQAFKSIKIDTIPFATTNQVSGEFTSQYPDDSVYANFKRKSVVGTNEKDIKKTAVLKRKIDNFKSTIEVAVYPYRGKSKIVYDVKLTKNFYLTPNGKTNYQKSPQKSRVESMLASIANE